MNKLIDELSTPGTKTEVDLFTVPPTQVAVRRSFWSEIHLQNPCTSDGPWTFRIPKDSYYMLPSKNYLYMKFRIVQPDGTVLNHDAAAAAPGVATNLVGPINLIGKTFFKQVKIYINGQLVSDSGDRYAHRAFLETELNYGVDAKESQLGAALYTQDRPGHVDTAQNDGWTLRRRQFENSQYVETMAPIHADLFQQDRYLLNQAEITVELYRNSDAFCLMSFPAGNPNYKIEMASMVWYVKRAELSDALSVGIESMLRTTPVKYPIRRTQITTMHVTENRRTTPLNALFTGTLPRRIIVGMVDSDAMRGTYTKSPFNFKHNHIEEIKITSGNTTVPSTPYRLDFANKLDVRAFVQMFEGLDVANENRGNRIDKKAFENGSCFFVFELTADGTDNPHWNLQHDGSTSLEMHFGQALPAGGVDVIIYAEFDSLIMMNMNREVTADYSI